MAGSHIYTRLSRHIRRSGRTQTPSSTEKTLRYAHILATLTSHFSSCKMSLPLIPPFPPLRTLKHVHTSGHLLLLPSDKATQRTLTGTRWDHTDTCQGAKLRGMLAVAAWQRWALPFPLPLMSLNPSWSHFTWRMLLFDNGQTRWVCSHQAHSCHESLPAASFEPTLSDQTQKEDLSQTSGLLGYPTPRGFHFPVCPSHACTQGIQHFCCLLTLLPKVSSYPG